MFTSISALRQSPALQDRVTRVENNLKKLNPSWQADWWFPVVAIGLSNSFDDVSWVANREDVLIPKNSDITIAGETLKMADVWNAIEALDDADFSSVVSRADAETKLGRINTVLSTMRGRICEWAYGIVLNSINSVEESPTENTVGTNEVQSQTIPDEEVAYEHLMRMTPEDVLAVLLKVNEAKGPLLKNAAPEEKQHFMAVMTGQEATSE